jgi:hypothetical protein
MQICDRKKMVDLKDKIKLADPFIRSIFKNVVLNVMKMSQEYSENKLPENIFSARLEAF